MIDIDIDNSLQKFPPVFIDILSSNLTDLMLTCNSMKWTSATYNVSQ